MKQLLLTVGATSLLAGCGNLHSSKYPDPFKVNGTAPTSFTSNCSASANGQCMQYTCKKDEKDDCSGFANGCVKGGNYYAGTSDGGKCTRVL